MKIKLGWSWSSVLLLVLASICLAFILVNNFFIGTSYGSGTRLPEKYYQSIWCNDEGGETEAALADRTRVDCLTETHAVEVDFGKKWAEAIGQALYYSTMTCKEPGIVLILENTKDSRFVDRIKKVLDKYNLPIRVWTIDAVGIDGTSSNF